MAGLELEEGESMGVALVVGVFEIDLVEVGSHGLQRKSRKNQWVKERGIRMASPVVVE